MTPSVVSPALFDAARAGDPAAIVAVLDRAQPDVRRYARVACRTSGEAEDAAQEALSLLFRRVGTIRSLAAFSGWLFAVVRRECLRLARRAGLVQPLADDDAERRVAALGDAELRLDLANAIEALPAHYREVVLLRDVRELSVGEIAAELRTTRETVKARLHRARVLLREYLVR
jgi:RNA polymerase sigma-70 factor (ECF subfamily)